MNRCSIKGKKVKILVTGGFGNIGLLVVEECLKKGYAITVFDVPSKRNSRLEKKFAAHGVRVILGDIRNYDEVKKAALDQDAVIHMAAILPPVSEEKPELCRAVNVEGTANLIRVLKESEAETAFIEVSSASVMGHTQDREPPVRPNALLSASDVYSSTKIEAESLIKESGLPYCVLRLSAVIPTVPNMASILSMVKILFDMPLDARCEIVFDIDVAYALVSAAEKMLTSMQMRGLEGFVAGGSQKGCQTTVRGLIKSLFEPLGLEFPDRALFPEDCNAYYLDWYDTENTEKLLAYQRHSIEDWHSLIRKKYSLLLNLIPLVKKPVAKWLERKSPRFNKTQQGN